MREPDLVCQDTAAACQSHRLSFGLKHGKTTKPDMSVLGKFGEKAAVSVTAREKEVHILH